MINIQFRSVEVITSVAIGECRRQQTDFRGLVNLLSAYEVAEFSSRALPTEGSILRIAQLIEPTCNENGYRRTPVTFANGGWAASWHVIPDAMDTLMDHLFHVETSEDIHEWTRQFLQIHPFIDGNGRTAWILFNWLRGSLLQPRPLPDFNF